MSYNKQYFISYGDDRPMAVERIKKQAESFNVFTNIDVYNNSNIYDDEFKEKYKYVLNQRRGGGYWLWKYYLINKKMKEIKEGEYIIYVGNASDNISKELKISKLSNLLFFAAGILSIYLLKTLYLFSDMDEIV